MLFVFDRWRADVSGQIAGIEPMGEMVLVQVQTDKKTPGNPRGYEIIILTERTSLTQENYLRTRRPITVQELQLGQKITAQYFSQLVMPALPIGRPVSDLVIVKW